MWTGHNPARNPRRFIRISVKCQSRLHHETPLIFQNLLSRRCIGPNGIVEPTNSGALSVIGQLWLVVINQKGTAGIGPKEETRYDR
jgi:hypothetical protein